MPEQARVGRWLLACAAALLGAASADAATNSITLDQLAGTWNNAETGDNVKIERAEIGWEAWFSNSGEARITQPPGDGATVKIDGRDFTCTYTVTLTAQTMNWNLTEGEPQAQCLKGSFTRVEPAAVAGKSAAPAPAQQPAAQEQPPQEQPAARYEPARRQPPRTDGLARRWQGVILPQAARSKEPRPAQRLAAQPQPSTAEKLAGGRPAPVQEAARRGEPTPEQKSFRRQLPAAGRESRQQERITQEQPRWRATALAPGLARGQEPLAGRALRERQRPAPWLPTRYRAWRFAIAGQRLQLPGQYRAYGYYRYWYVVVFPQCGCR